MIKKYLINTLITGTVLRVQSYKILVYGAGAAWIRLFCLEPEPTQFGRSRLRYLGTSGVGAAQKSGGSATLRRFHPDPPRPPDIAQ